MKLPTIIAASAAVLVLLVSNANAAESPDWPVIAAGKTLTLNKLQKLPPQLAEIVKKTYCLEGYPNSTQCRDISFTFVHLRTHGEYLLIEGMTLYGVSTLIDRNGQLVSLATGNPKDGFDSTAYLGQTKIDVAAEKLTTSFFFDYCGNDVWFPEYQYSFGNNGPVLIGEKDTNCSTGRVRSVWGAQKK